MGVVPIDGFEWNWLASDTDDDWVLWRAGTSRYPVPFGGFMNPTIAMKKKTWHRRRFNVLSSSLGDRFLLFFGDALEKNNDSHPPRHYFEIGPRKFSYWNFILGCLFCLVGWANLLSFNIFQGSKATIPILLVPKHIRDHKIVCYSPISTKSIGRISLSFALDSQRSFKLQSPLLSHSSIALRLKLPENHKRLWFGSASPKTRSIFWFSGSAPRLKPLVLSKTALLKTNGFRQGAAKPIFLMILDPPLYYAIMHFFPVGLPSHFFFLIIFATIMTVED